MERITGVEPASSAWEADVLPMNYIRIITIIYLFFTIVNSVCVIKRGAIGLSDAPFLCVIYEKRQYQNTGCLYFRQRRKQDSDLLKV